MRKNMTRSLSRHGARGLTLLEIMVVLLIMGMIAGIVTKVVIDRIEMARVETAKIQIAEFKATLDLFSLENSFYPTMGQGLKALVTKPTTGRVPDKWPEHGYMPSIPEDPWGNEYIYVSPGTNDDYEIICRGRDGLPGGEGFDADINSWELGGAKDTR